MRALRIDKRLKGVRLDNQFRILVGILGEERGRQYERDSEEETSHEGGSSGKWGKNACIGCSNSFTMTPQRRDWYIGRAQPSQGCETGSTPVSRSSDSTASDPGKHAKTACFPGFSVECLAKS